VKKGFYIYGSLVLLVLLTLGVTFATFTDKADFLGTTFSVASSDIKLLDVIGGGTDPSNLVDHKPGPSFENITPEWWDDYLVEVYNNATGDLQLSSFADYETANDPEELRQIIYVEIFDWEDLNADGLVQEEELINSYGGKSIVKWKSTGFDLGVLPQGEVRSFVVRFSTTSISPSKQGSNILFDFEFDALGL
jgi:hypothetical protein